MRLRGAEASGESEVLLRRQALVTQDQDLGGEKRARDLVEGCVGEHGGNVDARGFEPEAWG
jgi:hypothetical protein